MERAHVHALVAQRPEELVAADLRAHEDDRLVGVLGAQHLDELGRLLARLDRKLELLDGVDRLRRRGDLDDERVVEVAVGERADRRRHRRREERRLATRGRRREDRLDVLEEAEVEHLVGLVEDDVAAVVQQQRPARDEVEHAPDGADDDVAAAAQLRLLVADRRAAEDGDDVDAARRAVGAQRLGDLDAQLARRRQHERLHDRLVGVDVLDHRQAEGGGLAGARLRLTDHVAPGEQRRDRLLLDRARRLVADLAHRGQHRLGKAELLEGGHPMQLIGVGLGACTQPRDRCMHRSAGRRMRRPVPSMSSLTARARAAQ